MLSVVSNITYYQEAIINFGFEDIKIGSEVSISLCI